MTKGHYDKLAFALEPLKFNMLCYYWWKLSIVRTFMFMLSSLLLKY